jgi:hypothetical protein
MSILECVFTEIVMGIATSSMKIEFESEVLTPPESF